MDALPSAEPDDSGPLPESNTPVNYRPDLTIYGIEEVDRGICEDTVENRKILRGLKMSWVPIYDHQGHPTNHIEAHSADMLERRNLELLDSKKAILTNPRDKNSDFLTGLDLLYEPRAESIVPAWILHATRTYMEIEEKRALTPDVPIRPNLNAYPARCTIIKSDGIRCQMWTTGRAKDKGLCRIHVGSVLNTATGAIEQARRRISQAAPSAVDVMEEMLYATSEPVRLKAATEILDRAGVRGGVEIDSNVHLDIKPAAEQIKERLLRLLEGSKKIEEIAASAEKPGAGTDETVEAEIVDEDD